jgi:hypothetical protein
LPTGWGSPRHNPLPQVAPVPVNRNRSPGEGSRKGHAPEAKYGGGLLPGEGGAAPIGVTPIGAIWRGGSHERKKSARREDDQLFLILDETHNWTVNGAAGEVLAMSASLREAIGTAQRITDAGQRVSALSQRSGDHIVMFAGQIEDVRQLMNEAA